MKIKLITAGILSTLFMTSCSPETDSTEITMEAKTFTFEDIYEGSNSATVEMDSKAMIETQESIDSEKIESVFVSGVTLSKNDSLGLSQITSSKLQIMSESEDLPMVTVAVITEVSEDSKSVEMEIIKEVDLEEYLANGKIYLVLDANFSEDNEEEQPVEAVIKFDVRTAK